MIGQAHERTFWGRVTFCILVGVFQVYSSAKTSRIVHVGFVYFTPCKFYLKGIISKCGSVLISATYLEMHHKNKRGGWTHDKANSAKCSL